MSTIIIDGESKVGASSVMGDIADHFSPTMHVVTGDAGRFFRALDHDAQQYMGMDGSIGVPPYVRLDNAIGAVLDAGTPFDSTIDRGDLERPAIADTVSIVAKRPGVQAAGVQWFESAYRKAHDAGADLYVVNGRNPADRLQRIMKWYNHTAALSLLVYCEPYEAARRVLCKDGILDPTPEQLRAQAQKVQARRDADRDRNPADHPFRDPERAVPFDPAVCSYELVDRSRTDTPDRPLPIYFDATHMARDEMRGYAQSLAAAALELVVSKT